MILIRGLIMAFDTSISNENLMYIMSKQPDHVFKPWLRDRQRKIRVIKSLISVKKMVSLYRVIKNRGQKNFDFN